VRCVFVRLVIVGEQPAVFTLRRPNSQVVVGIDAVRLVKTNYTESRVGTVQLVNRFRRIDNDDLDGKIFGYSQQKAHLLIELMGPVH
jgi:hypothetical protein